MNILQFNNVSTSTGTKTVKRLSHSVYKTRGLGWECSSYGLPPDHLLKRLEGFQGISLGNKKNVLQKDLFLCRDEKFECTIEKVVCPGFLESLGVGINKIWGLFKVHFKPKSLIIARPNLQV